MARRRSRQTRWVAVLSAIIGIAVAVLPAHAQPPATNPNQMCGDGTTFPVTLPHVSTGTGGHDTIEVPRGCSIYLVIASDWGRNREFNELLFYPLAKYVAEHNGYVHYSWWNNFLKPYMAGPLHAKDKPSDPGPKTTIGMLESVFGLDVIGEPGRDEVYLNDVIRKMEVTNDNVGFWSTLFEQHMLFVQNTLVNVQDDKQFVSDTGQFIKAVRANHEEEENVLVFLAGHGFGGHSIVKVAKDPTNTIDLLAPIDPLGNETLPVGYRQLFEYNANPFVPGLDELSLELGQYGHIAPHSRWRAVFDFKGYQTADCIRGAGPGGLLCRDFDPRILFFNLRCKTPDPTAWQPKTPLVFTFRPFSCPGPLVDPGKRISLGANVGFFYHRYQQEWGPPVDFGNAYHYGFRSPVTKTLLGPNVQGPIVPGDHFVISSPPYYIGVEQTCQRGGPGCNPADGHDEIAGFRGEPTFQLGAEAILTLTASGVKARDWPSDTVSAFNLRSSDTSVNNEQRRQAMIELASTTINVTDFDCDLGRSIPGAAIWSHSPCTPNDCLVCEDLVTIATTLVGQDSEENPPPSDTIPPSTLATVDPEPNASGWHRVDVVVTLQANDETAGAGVKEIHYSTPSGTTIEPGSVVTANITSEGTTLLSFFAVDNNNNAGAPNQLQVKIDKTLPQIDALTDAEPNANGWFKTNVTVSFPALDVLSGVATVSPEAVVTSEGAGQEVEGTATDHADNQASASVTLNLDLTPPAIALDSRVPAPNAAGWNNSPVTVTWNCTDALSGAVAPLDSVTLASEGAAQSPIGTCRDLADHVTTDTLSGINIDMTPPQIAAVGSTAPNSAGWNNTDVLVTFDASDGLSGLASSSPQRLVSSEGQGHEIAGAAEDRAGNTVGASLILNIDKTKPAVALANHTPPVNAAGWNNSDVTLRWNCSDGLSGVALNEVSQLISGEGTGLQAIGSCADRAGNTARDPQSVKIDKTSPVSQITTPAEGAMYLLNSVVNAAYGCSDALSGVNACVGPVAHGAALDTATVGTKTFTVSAADAAGNQGTASHSYTVRYAFSGFSNPIAAMPTINSANAGRTVPVKYSIRDVNGVVISDLTSFVSLMSAPIACDSNVTAAEAEESDAPGNTAMTFESGKFHYNWKTSSAWQGTCRVLQLTLKDGTRHTVAFQFK